MQKWRHERSASAVKPKWSAPENPAPEGNIKEFLPTGKSERGVLAASGMPGPVLGIGKGVDAPISFDIPLEKAPLAHVVTIAEQKEEEIEPEPGVKEKLKDPAGCSGTAAAPEAEAGNLCVFLTEEVNLTAPVSPIDPETKGIGAGKSGSIIAARAENTAEPLGLEGDWVVTAE